MTEELLKVPREGASDDSVRLVRWLVPAAARVQQDEPVAEVETSKAAIVITAHRSGYLEPLAAEGDRVDVGAALARISDAKLALPLATAASSGSGVTVSDKARALMGAHGLSSADFPGLAVIRVADVERKVSSADMTLLSGPARFLGEELDSGADWDAALGTPEHAQLREHLRSLRKRMRAKFRRHVPVGTLLHDRYELAREHAFGEGSSVYDECVIFGDVQLGKHCWVGPFTILDGAHAPLRIGDYTSIGAGSQLYTHNTIEWALTGHQVERFRQATSVGRCCFISPLSMVGPGSVIGDHSFVAAHSYVQGEFPSHSYLSGAPARRVGRVELRNGRAFLIAGP